MGACAARVLACARTRVRTLNLLAANFSFDDAPDSPRLMRLRIDF
jgi:hypothetical protein